MSDSTHIRDRQAAVLQQIRSHRQRFTILGIVLIVLGALAILFPVVGSIAATVTIGWFLLLAGGITLWAAFQTRSWGSAVWNGVVGVLQIVVAAYLILVPIGGMLGLTIMLGLMFALQGGAEIAMALQNRGQRGWGWLMTSGVASAVLALIVLLGLPGTAEWALGLVLGINFLTTGAAFVALARGAGPDPQDVGDPDAGQPGTSASR